MSTSIIQTHFPRDYRYLTNEPQIEPPLFRELTASSHFTHAPITHTKRTQLMAAMVPRISLADGCSTGMNCFESLLSAHGYCIIRGLKTEDVSKLLRVESEGSRLLLRMHHRRRWQRSMHVARRHIDAEATQTRRSDAQLRQVPLAGIGLSTVVDVGGRLQRHQLHLVTDPAAMNLVPWPPGSLRASVEDGIAVLYDLSTRLLQQLKGGVSLERARAAQAAESGDLSVFDTFLYPNMEASTINMRAHTDPGLLTLKLSSSTPGLEVRDRRTGCWVDVEALCEPSEDCIVFCGEALQLSSAGRYEAALHRVRHASAGARVSCVFELRIRGIPWSGSAHDDAYDGGLCIGQMAAAAAASAAASAAGPDSERSAAHGAERDKNERGPFEEEELMTAEQQEARRYCLAFVQERLGRGLRAVDVLREFNVSEEYLAGVSLGVSPDVCDGWGAESLALVVQEWVATEREREALREAFERAEYVEVTPAFADCTGRFVQVGFVVPPDS